MPSIVSARRAPLLALALGVSAPALAADPVPPETGEPEQEIVVTGQRQQYIAQVPAIEVPASSQTLSAQTLRDAGVTRLDQALDFASGIARQNNFGGLFDGFACRGFLGDEGNASNYLVNGFNAARGFGGTRDASNIERIEILKGPQSALFGRGEPGCAVNIITKKPGFTPAASATLSAGSYAAFRSEGDVNLPLSSSVALRVTGAAERADSFRDTIHSRRYTVTPSLLAKLGSDTSLSYELEYISQWVPFDRGIVAPTGDLTRIPRTRFLGEPGDGPIRVRALGHQAQLQHDFGNDWSLILGAGYRDTRLVGWSSEPELAAGRQLLYRDGHTLSRIRRYRDYSTTNLTVRGELSGRFSTAGIGHHVLIGADWDEYALTIIQGRYRPPPVAAQTNPTIADSVDIDTPAYGKRPATPIFQNQHERQFSYGLYLQDQIDVTDRLKLRLAGRFDDFEQVVDNRIAATRSRQDRTAFSPQVGLAFLVSDALSLYVNHGRGFRPNSGVDVANRPFAPERTSSYEAGAKLSLFDRRLTGTLAAFTATKSNVLSADPVNSGFSLAIGKARSKGVELDLAGRLPAGFRVQLGYAYTDAGIAEDALDPNFGFALRRGDPLLGIPKHSGSLLLFRDMDVADMPLTLGGGVQYVGKRLGETGFRFADGRFFDLPAYTLVRLTATLRPTEHLRLSGEVTNLFDATWYANAYSRLWVTPGAPRQVMVRAGYSF